MPPRYAYWTILIDQKPTAFRAREREDLLPTFHQLKRKNTDVVMKWFARGRLWESPEAAQAAQRAPKAPLEKRGRDWRPGGEHRDPRDRFKKSDKPKSGPPRAARPWGSKPSGQRRDHDRRNRPTGQPSWRDRPGQKESAEQLLARPKPPERGR